ncbi:MAG: RNA polymerase sigma factor [Ignavibacteria bacterium]|nr:RNA polymerase sigma factor [Ignavibacteria bacterium]
MDENNKYIQNLIEGSKKGNVRTYYQLVSMYIDNVFTLLFRLSNDQAVALDLTKEVFLFAWKNIQQVRMNSAFISWMHGITIHFYLATFRERLKNDSKPVTKEAKIEHRHMTQLRLSSFDVALQSLDIKERFMLILIDVKKYTPSEVNEFLPEFPVSEIKLHLHSGRAKMAETLRK